MMVHVLVPDDDRDPLTAARDAIAPYYDTYDNPYVTRPPSSAVLCDWVRGLADIRDDAGRAVPPVATAGPWLDTHPDATAAGLVVEGLGMWKLDNYPEPDHPAEYVNAALVAAITDGRREWRIIAVDCKC